MHNFSDKDTYTLYYDIAEKQLAYVQFIYPEDSFELPEEDYITPKYISNDNRYLFYCEHPENDYNPVLTLVEPLFPYFLYLHNNQNKAAARTIR